MEGGAFHSCSADLGTRMCGWAIVFECDVHVRDCVGGQQLVESASPNKLMQSTAQLFCCTVQESGNIYN